jgi:3-deoxy-D-manno-octulosonate 8-phosphate phosphatase (KDO 8-P phosphatase)
MKRLSPLDILKKAEKIKLFVLDVDGVLTDGKIIIDDDGRESKHFHVRDGMGIAVARDIGYLFAIISGRRSKVVEHRATELKMNEIILDAGDKLEVFNRLLEKLGLTAEEAVFVGDDINDIPVLKAAGFSAAPADADESVKPVVDFVCNNPGGRGAVREVIELVLTVQDKWVG